VVLLLTLVVPALELAEVHGAGGLEALEEALHLPLVAGFGGADEVVVGEAEEAEHPAELRGVLVGEGLRGGAALAGGLLDLHPVLVGRRMNRAHTSQSVVV